MRDPVERDRVEREHIERDRVERPVEGEARYIARDDEPVRHETRETVERRSVSREPDKETYVPERTDYRGVRYGSTVPYSSVELTDLVRWGPIIAGFAAAMATLLIMAVLGGAIGATTLNQNAAAATRNAGTFSLIWGALSLILSFFIGGWLAARTAGIGGQLAALINSGIVWAFTLLFLLFLASLGAAGLAGALNNLPLGGLTIGAGDSAKAAWSTLAGLVIGLASALVGGLIGMHKEPDPINR